MKGSIGGNYVSSKILISEGFSSPNVNSCRKKCKSSKLMGSSNIGRMYGFQSIRKIIS